MKEQKPTFFLVTATKRYKKYEILSDEFCYFINNK